MAYVAPEEAAGHRKEPCEERGAQETSPETREQRAAAAHELHLEGALLEEQHGRPRDQNKM